MILFFDDSRNKHLYSLYLSIGTPILFLEFTIYSFFLFIILLFIFFFHSPHLCTLLLLDLLILNG